MGLYFRDRAFKKVIEPKAFRVALFQSGQCPPKKGGVPRDAVKEKKAIYKSRSKAWGETKPADRRLDLGFLASRTVIKLMSVGEAPSPRYIAKATLAN